MYYPWLFSNVHAINKVAISSRCVKSNGCYCICNSYNENNEACAARKRSMLKIQSHFMLPAKSLSNLGDMYFLYCIIVSNSHFGNNCQFNKYT